MDTVYLTTCVRYSIIQVLLAARENDFTFHNWFFCFPRGRLVEQPLNSSQTFIWMSRNWPGMLWGDIRWMCSLDVVRKMWTPLDCHVYIMPLGERIVTPVHLGRTPIPIDHGDKRNVHQAMASNALVGILHQLASVVRLADDIFCDISEECQKVFEKSERISRKIGFIEQFVKDLDAKTVTIRKFQQHI